MANMLAPGPRLTRIALRMVSAMVLGVLLYFALGALLLHYAIDKIVLHDAGTGTDPRSVATLPVHAPGGDIPLRKEGGGSTGCVLVFPGQHGRNAAYEASIVPALTARGVAVYLFSYDAGGSAPGRSTLAQIATAASATVALLDRRCGSQRLVIVGRSLGAMVAAYAVSATKPAGLVLESASPRLSLAIHARLAQRWYTRPWTLLPISRMLPHDYSLREAFAGRSFVRGILFQGTEDRQTPLRDLHQAGSFPPGMTLVAVAGANHSNTYSVARKPYLEAILGMLRVDPPTTGKGTTPVPTRPRQQ
ncbi:MAG: alpha/beta hydrolase [Rhodanobacter sp.]